MPTNTEALRAARDGLLARADNWAVATRDFAWPQIEGQFNWAFDWFDSIADGNHSPALVVVHEDGGSESYSFAELRERSLGVTSHLRSLGIGPGDTVLVMLGNQVELWESMLGVIRLGAVVMPATTAVGPADLVDRIQRGEVRAVICGTADAAKFAGLPGDFTRIVVGEPVAGWVPFRRDRPAGDAPIGHPGTGPEDRLLLYFTSGTTSRPKMVAHTQVSYPVGHLLTMYWIGLRPGDVHLNVSSPGWAKHAWSSFFAPWLAEATIVVLDYARFDPKVLLSRLHEQRITTFCAPPTVWRMLITTDLPGGPGRLRELVAAGEPLNPEVVARIQDAWGLTIRDGFGQTEMTAVVANTPGQPVKAGSMGRPLPGVPVVLVDPVSGEVRDDEGELCLDLRHGKPLPLMTRYDDPAMDAEAKQGGFFHTGDLASRDADGYITFIGRTDDVFKSSDYKVSPFELESVLIEHPAVAEAAVVPAPDPIRLTVPKAYIALAPGQEPSAELAESILKFAAGRLPGYLRVRRLEFLDLPKTISGKIRRVDLRHRDPGDREDGGRPTGEWRWEDFPLLSELSPRRS
ncbi:AMP-binding protein [Sphaerisporangium sp. NPDC051017]|uniref:AMP-binding protein n=1 Tax=Sphaerisporangium sp. NPDC051017 TaxID=3154636 RepID=UPI003425CCBD